MTKRESPGSEGFPLAVGLRVSQLQLDVGGRRLLRDAELELAPGELAVLVGISGCGKSSLLSVLAGLPQLEQRGIAWSGQLQWEPAEVSSLPGGKSGHAPRVGLVPQRPSPVDHLSPVANVQLAIDHRPSGVAGVGAARGESDTAAGWLERLGVPAKTPVGRLSGGQRQRLSLAQSLASGFDCLCYDEPTTGLDVVAAGRVAQLIRDTQQTWGVTSLVVTHDYHAFLGRADRWFLLEADTGRIRSLEQPTAERLGEALRQQAESLAGGRAAGGPRTGGPAGDVATAAVRWASLRTVASAFVSGAGGAAEWTGRLLVQLLAGIVGLIPWVRRPDWAIRFWWHFAWLVAGPTALIYLLLAGVISGFVTTYFTFQYLPYRIYSQPLLLEELLAAVGFALYRILVPVLASVLIAARCVAAVSADLSNRQLSGQWEALGLLGVSPPAYLRWASTWAFILLTPLLFQVAFWGARLTSATVFIAAYPQLGAAYWELYFHRRLLVDAASAVSWWTVYEGWWWLQLRLLLCGLGMAWITFGLAGRFKSGSLAVSDTITTTILWTTLWTLVVHLVVSLVEFQPPG